LHAGLAIHVVVRRGGYLSTAAQTLRQRLIDEYASSLVDPKDRPSASHAKRSTRGRRERPHPSRRQPVRRRR